MSTTSPLPEQVARGRHLAGVALFAGAFIMATAAILTYTGLLPVGEELRTLLTGVFAVVAAMDVIIGFTLLHRSQP
jgi:hypothetical protein